MVDVLGSKNHYVSKANKRYPFFARHVAVLCGSGPVAICDTEWMLLEINELDLRSSDRAAS
jgi:hypothetical protein